MIDFVLLVFTGEIRLKLEIHVSKCSSTFVLSILGSRSTQSRFPLLYAILDRALRNRVV
jgi:hypothetical protein